MDYMINTPCGALQGTAGRVPGTAAYKGIRYATAGRWEYPVQVTHWDGVYDATRYGACSYQPRSFYDEAKKCCCILQSGETAIYANVILQKGVIKA